MGSRCVPSASGSGSSTIATARNRIVVRAVIVLNGIVGVLIPALFIASAVAGDHVFAALGADD
jgi:hypothetical protein